MIITKNDVSFNVTGPLAGWFKNEMMGNNWENHTFNVIDRFANPQKVFVDIGSWIGPTALYAASKYSRVLCFEPDPVAAEMLRANIAANDMLRIELIQKAVSKRTGTLKLGGNGELGGSMSTVLAGNPDYVKNGGHVPFLTPEIRGSNIVEVECIRLEEALEAAQVAWSDIGMIKMDIEGGELDVIPAIALFLCSYKPILYISLHWVYLTKLQVSYLLDILFYAYGKCLHMDGTHSPDKKDILDRQLTDLVFTA